jgi:hypothetical protein
MSKSSFRSMIRLLAIAVLVLTPNSWAQNRPPILEQIVKTYGLDPYGKIEAIRYTRNGEITGLFKTAHSWEWEPKTGKISNDGQDKDIGQKTFAPGLPPELIAVLPCSHPGDWSRLSVTKKALALN